MRTLKAEPNLGKMDLLGTIKSERFFESYLLQETYGGKVNFEKLIGFFKLESFFEFSETRNFLELIKRAG